MSTPESGFHGAEMENRSNLNDLERELQLALKQQENLEKMAAMQRSSMSTGGYFDSTAMIGADLPQKIVEIKKQIREIDPNYQFPEETE
jgi:hypothetical protein